MRIYVSGCEAVAGREAMSPYVVNYMVRYLMAAGILGALTTVGFAKAMTQAGRNILQIVDHAMEQAQKGTARLAKSFGHVLPI